MKIAYVMNQYPYSSCTFIRREIAGIEKHGIEVDRFSIRTPETELIEESDKQEYLKTRFILSEGIVRFILYTLGVVIGSPVRFCSVFLFVIKIGWRSERGLFVHFIYLAEACVLLKLVNEVKSDFMHAHFGSNATTVVMLCRLLGGPDFSFTVHGPHEFDNPRGIALPEKIKYAAFVVAVSSFGKSQLFRWCKYEHWEKIHVVHCALAKDSLVQHPINPPQTNRFVSIGRLSEQKGQAVLIQAVRVLRDKGISLEMVLVGDGPMRNELEVLIRSYQLENIIRITGWLDDESVRRELLAARVILQPSFAEGLPVVLMEAFALYRPAITTYIAGIPELVEPGISGWLVPAASVDHLVSAMLEALEMTDEEVLNLGKSAHKKVLEQHDVEKESSKLVILFTQAFGA